MKVFFDYAIFTLQRFGGVSNYIVNLVENFSDQVDPLIISLFYKNHYLIIPSIKLNINNSYLQNNLKEKGKKVKDPFEYNSGTNKDYLSVGKIERFLKKFSY